MMLFKKVNILKMITTKNSRKKLFLTIFFFKNVVLLFKLRLKNIFENVNAFRNNECLLLN